MMYERITVLVVACLGLAGFGALGGAFEAAIARDAGGAASLAAGPALHGQAGVGAALRVASEAATAQRRSIRALAIRFPGSAVSKLVYEGKYFASTNDFMAHHVPRAGYHDATHSAEVSALAYDLAKRRGLTDDDALFLSEVGLVHDFDPARPAGSPARVAATRELLGDLAKRMGWDERRRLMAGAIIERTMHPFDEAQAAVYEGLVRRLNPRDRRFVLREAPILSEYADKGGNYMLRTFETAHRKVVALAREIDPTGKLKPADLNTGAFLDGIGRAQAFAMDHAVARRVLGSAEGLFELSRDRLGALAPEFIHRLEVPQEISINSP